MKQQLSGRLFRWILQTVLFVAVPMLLFFVGFNHIEQLHRDNLVKVVEQNLDSEMLKFEAQADTESFLAKTFLQAFREAGVGIATQTFAEYHQRLKKNFDYLLWNASGTFLAGTRRPESFSGDWQLGWQTLMKTYRYSDKNLEISDEEMINARKLFGPQVLLQIADNCRSQNNERLLWCDSTGERPLAWVSANASFSVAIFVRPELIEEKPGLEYYVRYCQDNKSLIRIGYVEGADVVAAGELPDRQIATDMLTRHEIAANQRFETPGAIFFPRAIEDQLSLFAYVIRSGRLSNQNIAGCLAALLLFLLLLPWVIMSGRAAFGGVGLRMSISRKLALLFVYSNGLPLAMLFFAGYDFINQKEFALFDEIHAQGTRYLQNLDERFESEHALQIVKIQKAIGELKASIRREGLNLANYRALADTLYEGLDNRRNLRLYLIASDANVFGTGDSLYLGEERQSFSDEILDSPDLKRSEEKKILNTLGRFILAGLNGQQPDPRSSTEVELIAESAMQKSLLEVQHEFISADGKIAIWGMGTNKSPACINLVSLFDDKQYDYMVIANWTLDVLESLYLRRQFLNANRNINDLQIGLINEERGVFFPENLSAKTNLRAQVRNFTHKPCAPRQFIAVDDHEYLIMGFQGKYLSSFNLLALYPVDRVKEMISAEKTNLVIAGLASLLLTMILGQFLAHSFLFPLQKLTAGAEAIRKRDFSVRLPPLGRDEFGEMAMIFNETMIDLEELKVAGVVQEHLLPGKLPECGCWRIHGQIVSMGDLGGDYFDYFNTSEGRFSVLIGDVAGRGAGAALVMAMAKAGVMQLHDLLENPAGLAMALHDLIKAAGRKTRKIMTFQYMNIDNSAGRAVYTNAGGWPPLIVNPITRTAIEIELPGPMLGALNRPRFMTSELTFNRGEAVIFYSDGVIEARNQADEVLGLAALKEMAVAAYAADPADYFARLLAAHRSFTGQAQVQDDMTLMIVVFNGAPSADDVV